MSEPAISRFVFSPLKPKYSLKKSGNKYRKAKFFFFFFFFERLVDICCYPNGKKKSELCIAMVSYVTCQLIRSYEK